MNSKIKIDEIGPIISSSHLVSEKAVELSEFEFGLIIANNAFERWIIRCMAAAGYPDLNALDVLVLHSTNHRDRAKKLADLCFVLNVEDTHTVNYALRKLGNQGLVISTKKGKEKYFRTSEKGREACTRYREVREKCLVNSLQAVGFSPSELASTARLLRSLSGMYDQAARAATSL